MNVLQCRNPACVFHGRLIDEPIAHNQCPRCQWPFFGELPGSMADAVPSAPITGASNAAERASRPKRPTATPQAESSHNPGLLKGWFGSKNRDKTPEEPLPDHAKSRSDDRVSDPSRPQKKKARPEPEPIPKPPPTPVVAGKVTLVPGQSATEPNQKPQYVLERVYPNRVEALNFIDEERKTPLYCDDPKTGASRILAHIKITTMGIVLTPKDPTEGVFVRIKSPRRLVTGSRFRIGNYMIEARLPARSEKGTNLSDPPDFKELVAQGELIFLRSDGSAGVTFPLLRKVLIGRGQPDDEPVDIPLLDPSISRHHASVAPLEGGLKLKDLKSKQGTFLEVKEPTYLDPGDSFRIGEMLLQLVIYPRIAV